MEKILVVGDDENILSIVKHILTSSGFDVQTHSGALNVPDIVMRYHPNIVLLEKSFADKLDREVCNELNEIHIHLPVILFSALVEEKRSLDLWDGDESIQRPFEINLTDTIRLHLN